MSETTGDPRELQKLIDWMNEPAQLEPVRREIREAENRLFQARVTDPPGWAMFERWWEDTHNPPSVPTVLRH